MSTPCPECHSNEIDSAGVCRACGFHAHNGNPPGEPRPKDDASITGAIEMDYATGAQGKAETPEWKQELSRRLQEIKHKREVPSAPENAPELPFPAPEGAPLETASSEPAAVVARRRAVRKRVVERQSEIQKEIAAERIIQPEIARSADHDIPLQRSGKATNPAEIQKLIDTIMVRQPDASKERLSARALAESRPGPFSEERLVLLSRTLSGLIDLIVVLFCTGSFIIASDAFSGVEVLDGMSIVNYGVLLLAVYFLYSIFFLASTNQTIGMMITDLQLTRLDNGRPRFGQIVFRCITYLLSLLAAGMGLLWGCFDGQSRCLHDKASGTRVIRL